MNFARNFTTLRKKMNLSQEQMAEKCGVSRSALAKWENGTTTPHIYMLVDIAKIYGVSVDELLSGKMDESVDDEIEKISEKLDDMQARLLEAIQGNRRAEDLYVDYCKHNVDMYCDENEEMAFVAMEQGENALECDNYYLAARYFEEALLYGNVSAFTSLLTVHKEILWIKGCNENESDYYSYMLEVIAKIQQYGKIVEDLIKKGIVF